MVSITVSLLEGAVVAVVVRRDGFGVQGDELRAFCGARLASFKVPKVVAFAHRLPRTASGKIRRGELEGFV